MKTPALLAAACALLAAVLAPTPSPAQDTDNAALLYWQAINAADPLNAPLRTVLSQKSSGPLDEAAAEEILRFWGYSLNIVERASEKPGCNWGLDFDEGPGMRLTQCSHLQEFAQAFRLRARLRLQRGDINGATDDLITTLRISRHAGEPALVISWLVQLTIRGLVLHTVADNLPQFSDAALSRLAATLETLPPGHPLPELMRSEKILLGGWLDRQARQSLRKHESAEQAAWYQEMLHSFESMGAADASAFRQVSMEKVAGYIGAMPQDYDELMRLMETPDPQSRPALHEFMERARAVQTASPLSAVTLTPFELIGRKGSEYQATQAMLLAAIEARLSHGGREALARESHDPYNDGAPFEVREVDGGLELSSKLIGHGNKPVILRCAW